MLESQDFEVVKAKNGFEAYGFVADSMKDNQTRFDLIVLDLSMPIMNGYVACSKIIQLYKEQGQQLF